jgi:predicted ArsR family transcriptional regulator
MSRGSIQEAILEFLQKQPGVTIPAISIAQETGFTRQQVLGGIHNLVEKGLVERNGNALVRYMGDPQRDETLYRLLATTANGDLVLEDDQGLAIVVRPI